VVPALVAARHDEDEVVQQTAQTALEDLALTLPAACACCARQLAESVHAEVALLKAGPVAVPALIEVIEAGEPIAQEKAARVLGALGEGATAASAALTGALTDGQKEVRLAAAKALWRVTRQAAPVVTALANLLDAPWPQSSDASEARRTFL